MTYVEAQTEPGSSRRYPARLLVSFTVNSATPRKSVQGAGQETPSLGIGCLDQTGDDNRSGQQRHRAVAEEPQQPQGACGLRRGFGRGLVAGPHGGEASTSRVAPPAR